MNAESERHHLRVSGSSRAPTRRSWAIPAGSDCLPGGDVPFRQRCSWRRWRRFEATLSRRIDSVLAFLDRDQLAGISAFRESLYRKVETFRDFTTGAIIVCLWHLALWRGPGNSWHLGPDNVGEIVRSTNASRGAAAVGDGNAYDALLLRA